MKKCFLSIISLIIIILTIFVIYNVYSSNKESYEKINVKTSYIINGKITYANNYGKIVIDNIKCNNTQLLVDAISIRLLFNDNSKEKELCSYGMDYIGNSGNNLIILPNNTPINEILKKVKIEYIDKDSLYINKKNVKKNKIKLEVKFIDSSNKNLKTKLINIK